MNKAIYRVLAAIIGFGLITFGIYSFNFSMNSIAEYTTPIASLMFGYFMLEFAFTGKSRLNRILKK